MQQKLNSCTDPPAAFISQSDNHCGLLYAGFVRTCVDGEYYESSEHNQGEQFLWRKNPKILLLSCRMPSETAPRSCTGKAAPGKGKTSKTGKRPKLKFCVKPLLTSLALRL